MIVINSSDFIRKPSYITQPSDITFVEDAKKNITKSVVIPYSIYEKIKEKIEDEIYMLQNQNALNKKSYDEFLEIEDIVEDLK